MSNGKRLMASIAAIAIGGIASNAGATGSTAKTRSGHRTHVTANGRCNGVSYGTGARSCGSATGGPAGGNTSRN